MENTQKLPRPNTGARAVIDNLMLRPLSYTEACDIYSMARRNISGSYPDKNYVGLTISRLLKKYGYKTGKSGSKAPWKFGSPDFDRAPSVCDPSDPECQDFESDRFSLPEDLEEDALTYSMTDVEADKLFPVDSLVTYIGPLKQDSGQLGRVIAKTKPFHRTVMWASTQEAEEKVYIRELRLYKEKISTKTVGSDDVGGAYTRQITPGLEVGDEVEYVGEADSSMKGVRGVVKGIYRNKRQVRWGQGRGPSTEDLRDLKPVAFVPTPGTYAYLPFKIGDYVICKKDGLTFPAKVHYGPTSGDVYKVVCPNGTNEWVKRADMTITEEKSLPNPTVSKPAYDTTFHESEDTKAIRKALEDSLARDKLLHWARISLQGLTEDQKRALVDVLDEQGLILSRTTDEDDEY